ncbi:MAG: UDP-N-acetylmuramoyl-L-alanyl-D-glutamate--2,6-diaminopimelate ligase [Flavobacteriales bacterium]|nr:UDP-N-acetylmuramoyl-L-alanyl-D-glutamate--2,6-diaminopimelate ligase [Flavobacteriales bacterium]
MHLKELIKKIEGLEVIGKDDIQITDVIKNSKDIKPGDLFVAINGVNTDGHNFIKDAISKGAKCILCEKDNDIKNDDVTFVITKCTKETYSKVCSNFFDNPSTKLKLIGITGTNGKTSSSNLLYQMFSLNNLKSGLISTNEIIIDSNKFQTNLTTPDSYDLNFYLNKMVSEGVRFCFMEVSSHSIDQRRISGLKFDLAIFTNITHDHLNYHKTFKNYLNVKKRFFDDLDKDSISLINLDDKNANYIVQNTISKVYRLSIKKDADYKLKIIENNFTGLIIKVDNQLINTQLIGRFNAYNLLTVLSASKLLNLDTKKIFLGLSMLKNPEGRFDVIHVNKIVGIVDYAHSPDALLNVLETILEIKNKENSIITVVGCGGGRDKEKRFKMGKIASKLSNKVIFTTDNPRDEDPELIIDDMILGVDEKDKNKVMNIVDRKEAIMEASKIIKPNDILLVAGKGHENYQIIRSKKVKFNDKNILKETLKMAV